MPESDQLRRALEDRDEELRELVTATREELAAAEEHVQDLKDLIERAERILDAGAASESVRDESVTLHEAMARVLQAHDGAPVRARRIAEEITEQGLYRKRDGTAVDPGQIHARATNYASLFSKSSEGVTMRHTYSVEPAETSGSQEAVSVIVTDLAKKERMVIQVGVSYSALAERPGLNIDEIAVQRAREVVAKGLFEDGAFHASLLTTTGWN